MASSQLSGLCPRARVHWDPHWPTAWPKTRWGLQMLLFFSLDKSQPKKARQNCHSCQTFICVPRKPGGLSPFLAAAHYDGGASASGSRVMGLHHVPITRSPVSWAVQLRFQSSRVTSHLLFIGVSSSVHKHQGFTEVLLRRSAESSNVPTSSTPRRPKNRSI